MHLFVWDIVVIGMNVRRHNRFQLHEIAKFSGRNFFSAHKQGPPLGFDFAKSLGQFRELIFTVWQLKCHFPIFIAQSFHICYYRIPCFLTGSDWTGISIASEGRHFRMVNDLNSLWAFPACCFHEKSILMRSINVDFGSVPFTCAVNWVTFHLSVTAD